MATVPLEQSDIDTAETQRRDALVERLFESSVQGLEVLTVYAGNRLGLYQALVDLGSATPGELASRAGTDERYTREWAEQQAVAGILSVDEGRFSLSPGHAEVLLDRDSLNYLTPLSTALAIVGVQMPTLVEAFRTGEGVPYAAYGSEARQAQEALEPASLFEPAGQRMAAVGTGCSRSIAASGACGGRRLRRRWAAIAIARAYPNVEVDGFDSDAPSIEMARANARASGVADRVQFHVRDVADPALAGRYDLVTAFEMVHDLGQPIEALQSFHRITAADGAVLIMDERTDEQFTAPGDLVQRFLYAFSPLWCLPQGLADGPSATGTIMRSSTLRTTPARLVSRVWKSCLSSTRSGASIASHHERLRRWRLVREPFPYSHSTWQQGCAAALFSRIAIGSSTS